MYKLLAIALITGALSITGGVKSAADGVIQKVEKEYVQIDESTKSANTYAKKHDTGEIKGKAKSYVDVRVKHMQPRSKASE